MHLVRRFFLLLVSASILFLWAGGLSGWPAWLVRALVALAGAGVAAAWVLRPWREMQGSVERLLKGDFEARLDDVGAGDLAAPARAFNAMAEHFADSFRLARAREERLLAVLDASDRGILLVNREGRVTLSSPVTLRLFTRFNPEAGLASLGLPGLAQLADEVLESGAPRSRVVEETERGQGRIFAVQAAPLGGEGVVLYLRDITSEARLERVKADLVANVSHELRTPLAAMGSLAETLADSSLPSEQRAHFQERLEAQIRRMQALVDDLLSLAKLESPQVHPSVVRVSLAPFFEEILTSLQPMAQRASVTLESRCPADLDVVTDRDFLETALRNLLENGIRYNRSGGRVELSAASNGTRVALTVKDTGEGIPAAHLPRIFERFYRVDPHRSREKGGTGLGLAIVKHAVGKLSGDVSAESAVGRGSTFTITLPATGRDAPEAAGE